jgi:hypothetical protein
MGPSLMLLAVMSLLAILSSRRHRPAYWPPLSLPVLGFVVATGVTILGSADVGRSLHLSAALLPALLLFVLIADHFPDLHATRLLYLTCCAVSLGLSAALLRPHRRLAFALECGLTLVALALLIDGCQGFPLLAKVVREWRGSGRLDLWWAAWAMFLDAPWVGHGPHTFARLYAWYLYKLGLPSPPEIRPWAHNLYLEVLAERGLVGFVALGGLLACALAAACRIQRVATGEARRLGAGALAGLIGLSSAAVIELTFLRQWVLVVLFLLLGIIAQLTSTQTRLQEEGT